VSVVFLNFALKKEIIRFFQFDCQKKTSSYYTPE
jgi:hypothetical protein